MRAGLTEATFPFLERLGVSARRELGALSQTRAKPGQRLLRQGDAVSGVFLLLSGSLRVYYLTPEGREATLYHVEPGGTCVLALSSSLNDEPYPAWVDAGVGGAAYVRVPSAISRALLANEAGYRDFVFSVLSGRVFELMRTLEEAGSTRVEQRVARYLARRMSPEGVVAVTQVGIASELGTAREVVSRALRSLAARGLVRTGRVRVVVLDRKALRGFVGSRSG
jgi:CRP/FNR family transcriptional regulator